MILVILISILVTITVRTKVIRVLITSQSLTRSPPFRPHGPFTGKAREFSLSDQAGNWDLKP